MKKVLLFILLLFLLPACSADVLINEILPSPQIDWNNNEVNETYGDEWIELYNPSTSNIELNNWTIGDKVKNYSFSNISLCSDCFIILFGSDTKLRLNRDTEEIYLYKGDQTLVNSYSYSSSNYDVSFARCPDGSDWNTATVPTPGFENNCTTLTPEDNASEQTNTTNEENTTKSAEDILVELLNAPETAVQGQIIKIKVELTNEFNENKDIQIYSYIYQGSTLITEGGWTGNKKEITLTPEETHTIELVNIIKKDAILGTFTLKVRAKSDGEDFDAVQSINILENKSTATLLTNVSFEIITEKQENFSNEITGKVIWTSDLNKSIEIAMLIFIAALVTLVIALVLSHKR